jgi:hypothetical protein
MTVRGVMWDVTVGGPGLVALGNSVWTSVDGITWTPVPDDDAVPGPDQMSGVINQGPYLVTVGSDGSGTVLLRDAVVWVTTLED